MGSEPGLARMDTQCRASKNRWMSLSLTCVFCHMLYALVLVCPARLTCMPTTLTSKHLLVQNCLISSLPVILLLKYLFFREVDWKGWQSRVPSEHGRRLAQ